MIILGVAGATVGGGGLQYITFVLPFLKAHPDCVCLHVFMDHARWHGAAAGLSVSPLEYKRNIHKVHGCSFGRPRLIRSDSTCLNPGIHTHMYV